MMVNVPTEGDFLATPDVVDEALENNRRNFLPAKAPTEIRRIVDCQPLTWTSTTPAGAEAWVDDAIIAIGLMCFEAEIESWEQDNDRSLNILNKYFPGEYQRISEALWEARDNVSTLRW
jgi:hypothetical protein